MHQMSALITDSGLFIPGQVISPSTTTPGLEEAQHPLRDGCWGSLEFSGSSHYLSARGWALTSPKCRHGVKRPLEPRAGSLGRHGGREEREKASDLGPHQIPIFFLLMVTQWARPGLLWASYGAVGLHLGRCSHGRSHGT